MALILLVLSTVASVFPMLSFLALIWWLDRHDREPVWLIALVFGWGAGGAITLGIVLSLLFSAGIAVAATLVGGPEAATAVATLTGPMVVAPLVEEPCKALVLLPVSRSRHFDNMTDGFVYGAAAGLGFGMTENLLYFSTAEGLGAWLFMVVIRTFWSALMHGTATAMVGASLGLTRFHGLAARLAAGTVGLSLAIALHATWNGLVTLSAVGERPELFLADVTLFPVFLLVTFVVFELCVLEESMTIRRELAEEAASGLLPADHPPIIASWFRRRGTRWLPVHVDRWAYIDAAATLAMRKKQHRQQGDGADPFYAHEVAALRNRVRELLGR